MWNIHKKSRCDGKTLQRSTWRKKTWVIYFMKEKMLSNVQDVVLDLPNYYIIDCYPYIVLRQQRVESEKWQFLLTFSTIYWRKWVGQKKSKIVLFALWLSCILTLNSRCYYTPKRANYVLITQVCPPE